MNTDLIFQFRAVVECGTVAKAAELLHMTPGALSRAIKRLEDELGVVLFMPSGRNILPTQAADRFYRTSEEIVRSIEVARKSLSEPLPQERVLRIATFEVFSTHFAAVAVARNILKEPVTLFERTPGQIELAVLDGSAEFGITYIPHPHPDLDHIAVGSMELGVFRSSSSPSENLPFAVPVTEMGANILEAKSLDGWPLGRQREIRYRFEMLESALDLTSRGKCRICCPKFIAKLENDRLKRAFQLVEERQDFRLPIFKIYLVKQKIKSESGSFKALARAVRMLINS